MTFLTLYMYMTLYEINAKPVKKHGECTANLYRL